MLPSGFEDRVQWLAARDLLKTNARIPEGFRGRATRLDALDLPKIGAMIGVGEDEIRAVMEVESRGSGFDKAGRPAILFEPHVFWRELGAGKNRDRAVREELAYPRWGEKPYPKDSYPRLVAAMAIDEEAALKACSWGLGQIMGGNFKAAGYPSVEKMVAAFCEDEKDQLTAMVAFIKASGLDDEIRRHDWKGFARGYNGPGYAKHGYDKRLVAAFAKWQAKPDLKFSPEIAAKEQYIAEALTEAARIKENGASFADQARIKAVQERLIALGYFMVGKADGHPGTRTAGAIAAFQRENGFDVTGEITDDLIRQLEDAPALEVSPARAEGEPENSRIIAGANATAKAGAGLGITGAFGLAGPALEKVEEAKGLFDRARDLIEPVKDLLADHWPLIALGLGAWLAWRGLGIVRARIEDFRSGKTA